MCPAYDWNVKSYDRMVTTGFCECLTGKAFPRDARKTFYFAILLCLIHLISTHTIYTHITHICWGVLFREKTLATILESERLLYPQFFTQSIVIFPQLLPLNFQIFERLIAQTLTTPILSVKWGFGAAGKNRKKPSFSGCNRAYCGIQRARQDKVPRSLVGVGACRAQVHWVD